MKKNKIVVKPKGGEYYFILAGEKKGFTQKLHDLGIYVGPLHLLVVHKTKSKLGRIIKKEADKKCQQKV